MRASLRLAAAVTGALLAAAPAVAEPVSARAAQLALQGGALAWDVRDSGAVLPGAVRVDARLLDQWLASNDTVALQRAVSDAGLDLSRELVVYGEPGDRRAQAVVESLASLAAGRAHWLVGGVAEWQMLGLGTQAQPAQRLPVPQRLVARDAAVAGMAGRARRDATTPRQLAGTLHR